MARMEPQKAAQILRAGNFARLPRYASPVMGVLGGRLFGDFLAAQKVTRRRGGETPPVKSIFPRQLQGKLP